MLQLTPTRYASDTERGRQPIDTLWKNHPQSSSLVAPFNAHLPSMDEWLVLIKLDRYATEIKEEGYDELEFLGPRYRGKKAP